MTHENRVALVTGASKGVGKGIALGLARSGWDVVVNYHRDAEGARQTINEIETLGRQAWVAQGDVGQEADVERMFAELDRAIGRIDLLVNNAGVQTWCPLLELSLADFERTIRTNLIGAFLCTQAAARRMRSSGGAIVNIGSGANRTPFPNLADYCASKGGLETLTKVAAVELGEHQIRVNCVAPARSRLSVRGRSPPTTRQHGPPSRRSGGWARSMMWQRRSCFSPTAPRRSSPVKLFMSTAVSGPEASGRTISPRGLRVRHPESKAGSDHWPEPVLVSPVAVVPLAGSQLRRDRVEC